MDQNGTPLKIEDKVNLTLLIINRNDTLFYRTKNKKIGQTIWIPIYRYRFTSFLIICEVELDLSWTKDCVIKENDKRNIGFNIKSNNIFVPKITLSINDYTRFCENFK